MTKNIILGIIVFVAVLFSSSFASASDVDELMLGGLLFGDTITTTDLKGCVVAIEFWDYEAPQCRDVVPKLNDWVKKYYDRGLALVSVHVAGEKVVKEKIIPAARSWKMGYPVFLGARLPGLKLTHVPHVIIYNSDGEKVFDGSPKDAETVLKDAMDQITDPLLGGESYTKLKSVAQKVTQRKDLGKVMADLRAKQEKSDNDEEKSEAARLVKGLTRYAQRLQARADGAKNDNETLLCQNSLQNIAQIFKGDEIGATAQKTLDELKKDKEFQTNLDSEKMFAKIQSLVDSFKPCQSDQPLNIKSCDKCQKKNKETVDNISNTAKQITKKYPGSTGDQKAQEVLKDLGLNK